MSTSRDISTHIEVTSARVARALALQRIGVGAALALAPGLARHWVGAAATEVGGRVLVRAFGARDIALGVGLWRALGRDASARGWLEAGVFCDGADLLGSLAARRESLAAGERIPPAGHLGVTAAAGTIAALGLWLAWAIDSGLEPLPSQGDGDGARAADLTTEPGDVPPQPSPAP